MDGEIVDSIAVTVSRKGETVAETTTDGNGWFGAVDLEPGSYQVRVPAAETSGRRTRVVTVQAGNVTDVSFDLVCTK